MKNKKINKKAYRIVAVTMMALVIGIYFATSNFTTYASDIVITGNAAGALSVTSTDTMLFELTGLYPGDTNESSVTIRNTDMVNDGFEVFMFASNTAGAEYDLGQVTRLTVTDGNTTIYNDMLIDFDESINSVTPISLGRLAKGTSKNLDFAIEIDGEKADNNYQEQQSHFVVTFVANTYGEPVPTTSPGGGDSGGGASTEASEESTPGQATAQQVSGLVEPPVDTIALNEPDVPLGDIELDEQLVPLGIGEPESDDTVYLDDESIPLDTVKEMPKTGEVSLALYIVMGAIITCFGLFIIMGNGKKRQRRNEDEK